ncbi:hypothetical protein L4D09_24155 [Photobacterium makurazakiensis]|uniref:hypothetical protein n=1 Tax=Photobacterium makurazakiensis TaxID=2910234 RepID=UPI003D0CB71F
MNDVDLNSQQRLDKMIIESSKLLSNHKKLATQANKPTVNLAALPACNSPPHKKLESYEQRIKKLKLANTLLSLLISSEEEIDGIESHVS